MILAAVRGFPAADGPVDVDIARGDVVLVRGPNGSGKTSLLRAIAGLDAPLRPASVQAERVGFSMQDARGALVGLTVRGEMRVRARRVPASLARFAEREVATLSSGEARRVSLAVAGGAPLLLLDEPSEGLDAEGRASLRALVQEHRGAVVAADHGDLLADLATKEVRLGPRDPIPLPRRRVRGFHALVGPNGCGKTTLLRRLAGLERKGDVLPLAPSDARALFLRATVTEEMMDARVADLLVPAHLRARHPLTLSGGEAQRVSLAKALGRASDVVLLDEPEAHLDADGRRALADAIALRAEEGACVLAATHDEAIAALAENVVRMGAP